MGISDRDYVRNAPKRRSISGGEKYTNRARGMGEISGLSVNTWLMLINITIFIVMTLLRGAGTPVYQGLQLAPGVTVEQARAAADAGSLRFGPVVPVRDENNQPVLDDDGRVTTRLGYLVQRSPRAVAPLGAERRHGLMLYHELIDASRGGAMIGYVSYRVMDPLTAYGHLSTSKAFTSVDDAGRATLGLEVWRFVTFQFLHVNDPTPVLPFIDMGTLHVGVNVIALLIFGGIVENKLGRRRYLAFYLTCGIAGGLLYVVLNLLGQVIGGVPGLLPQNPTTPLVGASAGVFGVIAAAARLRPKDDVLVFGVLPLRLRTLAGLYVGGSTLNLLFGGANAGGDAAHLGGAVAGWLLVHKGVWFEEFFDIAKKPEKRGRRSRAAANRSAARGAPDDQRASSHDESPGDEPAHDGPTHHSPAPDGPSRNTQGLPAPSEAEVDRILAKVKDNPDGVAGLSDDEREVLKQATARKNARR